jgi:hypothetical protein
MVKSYHKKTPKLKNLFLIKFSLISMNKLYCEQKTFEPASLSNWLWAISVAFSWPFGCDAL